MEYVTLGKTKLLVSRTSFGALPIQRINDYREAAELIQQAYDGGINFFDTARAYSDSEKKLGIALKDIRKNVIISTKTAAKNAQALNVDLEKSLAELNTDYIDIYQLHNPQTVPKAGQPDGIYEALQKAKKDGKIRFIGITNHSRIQALDAALSGLYDTVQYPFSMLSSQEEIDLVKFCDQLNIGFIAMKALCGGLLTNIPHAFGFLRQYENVVPIWGIQKKEELSQILYFEANPPRIDNKFLEEIETERKNLPVDFCRGCGYCMPCPAQIPIDFANRMMQLLRRAPEQNFLTSEWKEKMERINNCINCKECEKRCPYHLKPYETLPLHLKDYLQLYSEKNST